MVYKKICAKLLLLKDMWQSREPKVTFCKGWHLPEVITFNFIPLIIIYTLITYIFNSLLQNKMSKKEWKDVFDGRELYPLFHWLDYSFSICSLPLFLGGSKKKIIKMLSWHQTFFAKINLTYKIFAMKCFNCIIDFYFRLNDFFVIALF